MILQVNLNLVIRITILSCLILSACRQQGAAQAVVNPTAATESATVQMRDAILYRGDTGRTGSFNLQPMEAPVEVQWQREVGASAHGGPLLWEDTLLVPTVAGRFVALDASSGEEKWTFEASGDLFSSPAVLDQVVYIGNENGNLYALDPGTGMESWSLELGSGIWTAPLVVDETVYVGSQSGTVSAVNTETHQIRWEFKTGGWVMSPAAWEDGVVFVSGGAKLYALEAATGAVIWEKAIGEFWGPHAVASGVIYAGNQDRSFYALDAGTGATLWSFATGDDGWSAPAITDDSVFFGNRLSQLFALDARTGELRWTFEAEDWTTTDPVVTDGVVYLAVGNHDRRDGPRPLYAIDSKTGEELWRFEADGRLLTAPAPGSQILYFVSFPGTVYALTPAKIEAIQYRGDPGRSGVYDEPAPDAFTGVKWQRSFDEDAYFPMYANETLYIGTASGKLLALDPESGDERWSYSTGNGPILAVAVAGDLVYFGAGDHGFYAVDTQDGELAWSFETDGSVWSSSPLLIGSRA